MFRRKKKKTKADLICEIIATMSYAEMMELGKQLYVSSTVLGIPPISDDQFARIMYEWTQIENIEPRFQKPKANGFSLHKGH